MPLWGSKDDAANSAGYAVQQVNLPVSTANEANLYGNTTPNVFVAGATVGQFGVDTAEQQALRNNGQAKGAHAGWNLRTVGQGMRSGRVFIETLVAMGSLSGDASDDSILPDISLKITGQPQSATVANNGATTFGVQAVATPPGTVITYQWQRNGANIADAGVYSGAQTAALAISNVASLNANSYGVMVYAGSLNVRSANAVLTVV